MRFWSRFLPGRFHTVSGGEEDTHTHTHTESCLLSPGRTSLHTLRPKGLPSIMLPSV